MFGIESFDLTASLFLFGIIVVGLVILLWPEGRGSSASIIDALPVFDLPKPRPTKRKKTSPVLRDEGTTTWNPSKIPIPIPPRSETKPLTAHANTSIETRQIVGFIGVGLLSTGVFMPVIQAPIVGTINFFNNGKGDGTVLLIASLITVLLLINKKYPWVGLAGVFSAILLAFDFYGTMARLNEAEASMKAGSGQDGVFSGLAEAMAQTIQLQYGWIVMGIGVFLIIAAGAMRSPNR